MKRCVAWHVGYKVLASKGARQKLGTQCRNDALYELGGNAWCAACAQSLGTDLRAFRILDRYGRPRAA